MEAWQNDFGIKTASDFDNEAKQVAFVYPGQQMAFIHIFFI